MDLSRIPMPYRARVRAIVQQTRMATIVRCSSDDLERAAQEAKRDALAPFLAIADEADAAMHRAADEARRNHLTAPDREQLAHDLGMAERAAVWARRLSERDAAADTDPPLPWTPKPGDRVRTLPQLHDRFRLEWTKRRRLGWTKRQPNAAGCVVYAITWLDAAAWLIRHDDGTNAPYDADELRPEPMGDTVLPEVVEGFLSGTTSTEASLVITNGQGAIAALDAVARYLETHVAALPAEVAQRVIALLAATLPAGPLAPSADVPATLRTIAGLVQTLPAERPELYLGEEPALHAAVGALPGAEAWTQPYPLKAPEEWLDAARATVEGLLVQATRHRPMTAEERAAHKGAP